MKNVTVSKSELITRLTENLETHKADFANAHGAWQLEAIQFHRNRIDDIKAGTMNAENSAKIEPVEPTSHEKNYTRALEMLAMEVSEVVTLSGAEFAQFVQDEWHFSDTFRNQVSGYTGKLFD